MPGGDSAGHGWQPLSCPARADAKRKAQAEPSFAQVSAAGTHLSPRTRSCFPANAFIPVNFFLSSPGSVPELERGQKHVTW